VPRDQAISEPCESLERTPANRQNNGNKNKAKGVKVEGGVARGSAKVVGRSGTARLLGGGRRGGSLEVAERTILELSELVAVLAEPRERRTVKAAARCLKASVSGPPPATSNNWRSRSIDAYVFPDPLVPAEENETLIMRAPTPRPCDSSS
jgi:hypothetical protein